jgi:hypothetical protein
VAEFSLPSPTHNGRAVNDIEVEQLHHPWSGDGLVGSPADTDMVYADASGMNVKLRAEKFAIVRGRLYGTGSSDITKTITANASGLTRVDLVVLRLDRATYAITSVVKAGTPGAGAPALTQDLGTTGTFEIPVATVSVPTGDSSIAADQVTRVGWYLGEQIYVCTSTTRPAHKASTVIWETDTSRGYVSTGAAWRVWSEEAGSFGVSAGDSGWTLTNTSVYRRNGFVTLEIDAPRTSGSVAAGSVIAVIPTGFRPLASRKIVCVVHGFSGIQPVLCNITPAGILTVAIANPIDAGYTVYGSITYPGA